jgi:predicted DNA-binding transcriptional regulator YafY
MLNMLILEILEVYSDEKHPLTQQEILRLLKSEYGIEHCDRRSVKSNVLSLVDMGYEISMEEGEGYYLISRRLEDEELRWLIDAVLFSKTLPAKQAKSLIKKLEEFGNKYFESKVSHVRTMPDLPRTENTMVLHNVHTINDAIEEEKKIIFRYNRYGTDFKLHDRGRDYKTNPYQMIASNGYYYLLSNLDEYDEIAYFRIDKISKVRILDEKVKPMNQVHGLEHGLDLPSCMAEHVYMFSGESKSVKLRCAISATDALADGFGRNVHVLDEDDESGTITVQVKCNLNAMFYWALQYGTSVEVLEPAELRQKIKDAVQKISEKYEACT